MVLFVLLFCVDCPVGGKTKYKCNVCRRTFYDANSHRMSREQKERILKEYLNRMSMRGDS